MIIDDEIVDTLSDSNDTNEDELFYFARIKNHYLHLVKSSNKSVNKTCNAVSHYC